MPRLTAATAMVAALALTGAAVAAPVTKPSAPAVSWTGCYAGVQGGGAWERMSAVAADPGVTGMPFTNARMSGALIGGTLGCNYQTGKFVFGLENDLSWRRYDVRSAQTAPFLGYSQTSANWLDTLRGRVGYATDRWLLYVTGGAAFTDMKVFVAAPGFTPVTAEIGHDLTGWTIGAGVEWALPDPRWSVKAEYLYIDYGSHKYDFNAATAGVWTAENIRLTENVARIGLNYRFGGL